MRVRLNNGDDYEGDGKQLVKPLNTNADLYVVVDPGKTNMAVLVGTAYGKVLQILEFSGKDMDNLQYCMQFKAYLTKLLSSNNILLFAQEKPILQQGNKKEGYQHYHSNMILTEIRSHLRELAYNLTGRTTYEINNFAWKGDILPVGYRGHAEKGSKRFLEEVNPIYRDYTHDVTDAVCMYLHLVKRNEAFGLMRCVEKENRDTNYVCALTSKGAVPNTATEVGYNSEYSVEENANYIANRVSGIMYAHVGDAKVSLEDYFKYGNGFLKYDTDTYLVIKIL